MRHFLPIFLTFCVYSLPAQVIFPGDMNNDGRANYLDLLPLGLAYGQEGPPRAGASFQWTPQPSILWPFQLPISGVNLGFVDADGNGFIDSLDIEAIVLNYDSIQALSIPPPMPYFLPEVFPVPVRPRLVARFEPAIANPGETVRLVVDYIVPPNFPLTASPLATAFRLKLNQELLEPDVPIEITPNTDSDDLMFVAATNTGAQFWRTPQPGIIEMAASGKGDPALSQSYTPLFEASIVIEDMILFQQVLSVEFLDPLLINTDEMRIEVETENASLLIVDIEEAADAPSMRVLPNPAVGLLHIETGLVSAVQIALYSISGRLLRSESRLSDRSFTLDVSGYPPGVYVLQVITDAGSATRRVVLGNF